MIRLVKHSLIILSLGGFILLSHSPCFTQWEEVKVPSAFSNVDWLDVYFLESNPAYGWICGRGGAALRTIDGGETWKGVYIPGADQLESVCFPTASTGYVSGIHNINDLKPGVIFKTRNGGKTWIDVTPPGGSSLWGNYFINENTGVVVGEGCEGPQNFFRTVDGGQSWVHTMKSGVLTGMSDVLIYGADSLGFASSSGRIWRTRDGGKDWEILCRSGDTDWQEEMTHYGESFLMPFSGSCMGGDPGGMRISTDYGKNWSQYETGAPMYGAFLLDSLRGWACGHNRSVYYTSNGGVNWELRVCGTNPNDEFDDIWFINDSTGWLVGNSRVYKYSKYVGVPPEIAALGDTVLCEGDSLNIISTRPYNIYKWSTGETTRNITVRESGEYWLYAENNDECDFGESNRINVVFIPEPDFYVFIVGNGPFCDGDTVELRVEGDIRTCLWSTGDITRATQVTETGEYFVTVSDTSLCEYTRSLSIEFFPAPEPVLTLYGSHSPCEGDSAILRATPGYSSYVWSRSADGDTAVIDSGRYEIIVSQPGKYSVRVENEFGCGAGSDEIEIIFRRDSNQLEITPAPGKDYFYIDSTLYPHINCALASIRNKSWKTAVIEDVYIKENTAFSIPQSQFPIVIPPFGTVDLEICYSPTAIGLQQDTLRLPDVCWPHILPLVSVGNVDSYNGVSKCGVPVRLTIGKISNKYYFTFQRPFPNPASQFVETPFTSFAPHGADVGADCILFDAFGSRCAHSLMDLDLQRNEKDGTYRKGKFIIGTGGLPQGIYFILVKVGEKTKTFPIIINK